MILTLIQQAGVIMSSSKRKEEENEAQTVKSLVEGCLFSIDGRSEIWTQFHPKSSFRFLTYFTTTHSHNPLNVGVFVFFFLMICQIPFQLWGIRWFIKGNSNYYAFLPQTDLSVSRRLFPKDHGSPRVKEIKKTSSAFRPLPNWGRWASGIHGGSNSYGSSDSIKGCYRPAWGYNGTLWKHEIEYIS